ncbi:hypothetical protein FJU08_08700 [Martelella alba]|uniref:Uncharacterized protein n=1 Tax=Martelella alba TaxID=2590451 RepID=A0A506UFM3_9HYPH|nr:hypothetical protein [Martelella alba]TPW31805.1 hypothetical protein FJU08_08700 [Martelella alba]
MKIASKSICVASLVAVSLSSGGSMAIGCDDKPYNGKFADGSLIMTTRMNVNPDGTSASYTVGDHGYTYIANGVNLHLDGKKIACSIKEKNRLCRKRWIEAERADFLAGSPEFCVFALEVEPIIPGTKLEECEEKDAGGRYIVGNGKGRPKLGKLVPHSINGDVQTYVSTTALTHIVDGKVVSIDAATVPGLVVPKGKSSLLGSVAWVRYGDHSVFAIVTDIGPGFGEGSIALHEMLRYGALQSKRPIGPISREQRCTKAETNLKAPYQSRPDYGDDDKCRKGHKPKGGTDIRAYGGIKSGVTSIILPLKPEMNGRTVRANLNTLSLREIADTAGYSEEKLRQMAACGARVQ